MSASPPSSCPNALLEGRYHFKSTEYFDKQSQLNDSLFFLSSRTSFPFLSKSIGEGKVGSGVVKPLVSQVRPLMEHNQGQSHNQDRDQTQSQGYSQSQDYGHSQRKLSEDSQKGPTGRLEVVDTTEKCFNLRASPLRKKLFNPAVDSRRMVSPVAKAAASHLTTTGMRKSQSVQNLHTEGETLRDCDNVLCNDVMIMY